MQFFCPAGGRVGLSDLLCVAVLRGFWRSGSNVFSAALLLLSLVAVFAEGATSFFSMQNFRPIRALRVLKIVSFSPTLQALVVMLAKAMKRALYVMCLVFFIMFIFAVAGVLYFGEQATGVVEHWGDLALALLTIFGLITLDSWVDLLRKVDSLGVAYSRLFPIIFILVGHFVFFNMFVGLVIMEAERMMKACEEALQEQEQEATQKRRKQKRHFSAALLLLSLVAVFAEGATSFFSMQNFRPIRALRVLKIVSFSPTLQALVVMLAKAMKRALYVMCLVFFIMFIFAVAGVLYFGEQATGVVEHWGDLALALLTIFGLITLDSWVDLLRKVDSLGVAYSRLFPIIFILVGHFVFFNMFVGLVIMEAERMMKACEEALQEQVQEATQKRRKQKRHFSAALLLLSLVAVFAEGATSFFSMQNFRPIRALRVLKIVSFSPTLQALVVMLAKAMKRALYVMCLVFFIMFIFAVAGVLYFGEQATGVVEHWGDLALALLTIFGLITLDSWVDLLRKVDSLGVAYSRLFPIIFILVGHFVFFNMFVGLVIMEAERMMKACEEALQEQEQEATQKRRKQKRHFSAALLLLSLVAVFAEGATSFFSMQNFRPIRALRVLKIVSFSPTLQALVVMLAKAMKRALYVMCLVFFIMFIFAVAGVLYFGEQATGVVEHWGDLALALLTIFGLITLDSWVDLLRKVDSLGVAYRRLFPIIFILVGHFVFFNMFVGLVIMEAERMMKACEKALQEQEQEATQKRRKQKRHFSAALLLLSLVAVFAEGATSFFSMQNFRPIHALRVLKIVSFSPTLQALVVMLAKAMKRALYVMCLVFFIMFIFAVAGVLYFGEQATGVVEHWGDLAFALLTIFGLITLDSWVDLLRKVDSLGVAYSRLFPIIFILVGHFVFFNMFVGLVIMEAERMMKACEEALQEQEQEATQKRRKQKRHLSNAFVIALEEEYNNAGPFRFFCPAGGRVGLSDLLCVAVLRGFWRSGSNVFNAALLLLSLVAVFAEGATSFFSMQNFRPIRALRVLKIVSFSPTLQALVVMLAKAMKRALYVMCLVFFIMFIFAVAGVLYFGEQATGVVEHWGDLALALLTIFGLITLDSWVDLLRKVHSLGVAYSRLFPIIFILVGHFVFFNMLVGLVIMEVEVSKLKKWSDTNVRTDENFPQIIQQLRMSLSVSDYVVTKDKSSSLTFLQIYLTTLRHQDTTLARLQQIYDEMLEVLSELLELQQEDQREEKDDGDAP
ncbi:hypothetical protein SRHO_G00203870 [Serrasalmus rhombeus]